MKKDKELIVAQVNDDEDYDDVLWGEENEMQGHYHFIPSEVSFMRGYALRIWNENGVDKWQVIPHYVAEALKTDVKGEGLTINEAIQDAMRKREKRNHK